MKFNIDELRWILEELHEEYENSMEIRNLLDIIFKDIREVAYYDRFRNGYDEAEGIFEDRRYCEED